MGGCGRVGFAGTMVSSLKAVAGTLRIPSMTPNHFYGCYTVDGDTGTNPYQKLQGKTLTPSGDEHWPSGAI
jgi:hypothetical protein